MQVFILGAFLAQGNQEEGGGTVWGLRKLEKQSVNASVSQMDFLLFSQVAHTLHTHIHYARGDDSNRSYFVTSFFRGKARDV